MAEAWAARLNPELGTLFRQLVCFEVRKTVRSPVINSKHEDNTSNIQTEPYFYFEGLWKEKRCLTPLMSWFHDPLPTPIKQCNTCKLKSLMRIWSHRNTIPQDPKYTHDIETHQNICKAFCLARKQDGVCWYNNAWAAVATPPKCLVIEF